MDSGSIVPIGGTIALPLFLLHIIRKCFVAYFGWPASWPGTWFDWSPAIGPAGLGFGHTLDRPGRGHGERERDGIVAFRAVHFAFGILDRIEFSKSSACVTA